MQRCNENLEENEGDFILLSDILKVILTCKVTIIEMLLNCKTSKGI